MKMSEKRLSTLSPTVAELLRSYMMTAVSRTANNIKADIGATRSMIREKTDIVTGRLDNKRREIVKEGKTALAEIQENEKPADEKTADAETAEKPAAEAVIINTLKKGKGKAVQPNA